MLKQFVSCRYFLWNRIPRAVERSAIGGQRQPAVWHSGTRVSLCCLVSLASFTDFWFQQVWTAAGFWKLDLHGSLDPALNPSDFYLLAEAAVISSIAAWRCSRFCRSSRLGSPLPVLGHPVPLFRFVLQRYWDCMAASVCFASVSPRRLSAWAQLFQRRLTPAN